MRVSLDVQKNAYQRFKFLVERFCQLLAREGVPLLPYQGDGPSRFAALPEETQVRTLEDFQGYVEVSEEVVRNGERIGNDNQFLWRMFPRLKVRPASDLMANLEKGDIIEIYNASGVQVFRNLQFFSVCSYTLDDLLSRPFWELYRRDEGLTPRVLDVTGAVLSGKVPGIQWWDIPHHTVEEIESAGLIKSVVALKLISPLYDQSGNVTSFVNVFRCLSCERTVH